MGCIRPVASRGVKKGAAHGVIVIAFELWQCDALPPGHLGQKFSDNRRGTVLITGRGKIALGR